MLLKEKIQITDLPEDAKHSRDNKNLDYISLGTTYEKIWVHTAM
jgi:hypothetical protein